MTLLPKYDPTTPDPRAQVDRITPTSSSSSTTTARTWTESASWLRGIPMIGPSVNCAIPGTDPAHLAEDGYFDR